MANTARLMLPLLLFLCCQLHSLHGGLTRLSHSTIIKQRNNEKNVVKNRISGISNFQKIVQIRGGSDVIESNKNAVPVENCAIVVSTSVGSVFLDKKKRLSIPRNSTIAELKSMIEKKFPGCPPIGLQKLFLGVRALADDELIGNITTSSPTPILLDMISGTSVYNRTLSISQALEAHAALIVQQSYLGAKMVEFYGTGPITKTDTNDSAPVHLESGVYRDMFDAANRTLYETYAEDIAEALERETEPETLTDDTAAWRGKTKEATPLIAALAKEFDLNMRGIRSFCYYSILLGIFAFYGTTSVAATQFLLLLVPFLWLSKLRQLRLIFKIMQYLVLPVIPHIEFLMPLLPAPQQVIAIESAKWSTTGEDTPEPAPILPQPKQNRGLDGIVNKVMGVVRQLLSFGGEEGALVDGESQDEGDDKSIALEEDGEEQVEEEEEEEVDEEIEEEGGENEEELPEDLDIEEDEDFQEDAEEEGEAEAEAADEGLTVEDDVEEDGELDGEEEVVDEDFRDD